PAALVIGLGRFLALAHHARQDLDDVRVADRLLSRASMGNVAILDGGEDQAQCGEPLAVARLLGGLHRFCKFSAHRELSPFPPAIAARGKRRYMSPRRRYGLDAHPVQPLRICDWRPPMALLQGEMSHEPRPWDAPKTTAVLVLAAGTVIEGTGYGAVGVCEAEVCFNAAITGYQEILTEPYYAGQNVTFTFPHIGNVGANEEDIEHLSPAARAGAAGAIFRADITSPS